MLLSSGVIWRHRDFERFRAECPDGDAALQRTVFDRLDADLEWLESLGARPLERDTGNPLTTGARFDTRAADRRAAWPRPAARSASASRSPSCPAACRSCSRPAASRPTATLVRAHVTPEADELMLRATPWSTGDGLRLGLEAGGAAVRRDGRVLRAQHARAAGARRARRTSCALAQLYATHATVRNARRRGVRARAPGRRSTSCSGPRASRARAPGTRCADERSRATACATARSAR